MTPELNERELPDDYPMHSGYLYVADDHPIQYWDQTTTVGDYKKRNNKQIIKNCDIAGRKLWEYTI